MPGQGAPPSHWATGIRVAPALPTLKRTRMRASCGPQEELPSLQEQQKSRAGLCIGCMHARTHMGPCYTLASAEEAIGSV